MSNEKSLYESARDVVVDVRNRKKAFSNILNAMNGLFNLQNGS